jgi:hypothetical protein
MLLTIRSWSFTIGYWCCSPSGLEVLLSGIEVPHHQVLKFYYRVLMLLTIMSWSFTIVSWSSSPSGLEVLLSGPDVAHHQVLKFYYLVLMLLTIRSWSFTIGSWCCSPSGLEVLLSGLEVPHHQVLKFLFNRSVCLICLIPISNTFLHFRIGLLQNGTWKIPWQNLPLLNRSRPTQLLLCASLS